MKLQVRNDISTRNQSMFINKTLKVSKHEINTSRSYQEPARWY